MLSLIASVILASFLTTLGYFFAGLMCFLLGFINIPGYRLWTLGQQKSNSALKLIGATTSWVLLSYFSVTFGLLIMSCTRILLYQFPYAVRWPFWIGAFIIAVVPSMKSSNVSWQMAIQTGESDMNTIVLSATTVVSVIAFILFTLFPQAALVAWSWLPLLSKAIAIASQ